LTPARIVPTCFETKKSMSRPQLRQRRTHASFYRTPSSWLGCMRLGYMRLGCMHLVFSLLVGASLQLAQAQAPPAATVPGGLEEALRRETPQALVEEARRVGDPARGAVLFHQPLMSCTKCHVAGDAARALGPDLTRYPQPPAAEHLVESLLQPSAVIRKGYETFVAVTEDGQTIQGLLVEETPATVVLRDMARDGRVVLLERESLERFSPSAVSLMPAGLVNLLPSRGHFLDLLAYLFEVAEKGPSRALELRPPDALIAAVEVPEYETRIDHAGLLGTLDGEAFRRGEAIYNRVCANCHGTHQGPGSMPTSLRFADGRFKNGADPLAMYRTLTHGFGLMPAQSWMVPQQKYDVIHYIREAYLKPHNATQYAALDSAYLAALPRGDTRGPAPSNLEPWITMDYGISLINTYEVGQGGGNIAQKGIAVRLDPGPGGISRGRHWMLFDHDTLRMAAAWSGSGFIDWNGIHFNGAHGAHPRLVGDVVAACGNGPGWAEPGSGSFEDPRIVGRDGKRYGPLPRDWAHYRGLYQHGQQVVVAYSVGGAEILEQPGWLAAGDSQSAVFTRTLNIRPADHELLARIAPLDDRLAVSLAVDPEHPEAAELLQRDGFHLLRIKPGTAPLKLVVLLSRQDPAALATLAADLLPADLSEATRGGRGQWPERLLTQAVLGDSTGPLAVDVLAHPASNPWNCQMRLTGIDFFDDGDRAAVCSWDGDVWLVEGLVASAQADSLTSDSGTGGAAGQSVDSAASSAVSISWRRIAAGLFQPLGIKVIAGDIFVTCRDQIVILRDLDGDGQTDFYENFNNDHQVTEHFHEFAMGLQVDGEGNLYYAKSARHALPAVVPHHGTVLRVSRDGQRTEILATGFRAANGICLNPDGTFFVTDQEGHWIPKNRINWVRPGRYYGNAFGYHDVTDTSDAAMDPPLCWITNAFDRSPAELVRVDSPHWGALQGSLLNLSYGYGKVFVVPHEQVGDRMQGGMVELPLPPFPTGVMRGRFHPGDGQLYLCGMFAWAGNRTQPGGLYRLRATGQPLHTPIGLNARQSELRIEFSAPLDAASVADPARWALKVWSLRRTANYGSDHHDERPLAVAAARLENDGRTVSLQIPDLAPTWCMEIKYELIAADGKAVSGTIHNTIHELVKP
jgi:putative heme-binding domain-containing protein